MAEAWTGQAPAAGWGKGILDTGQLQRPTASACPGVLWDQGLELGRTLKWPYLG